MMAFGNRLKKLFGNKKEGSAQSSSPDNSGMDKKDSTVVFSREEDIQRDDYGQEELDNTLCFKYLQHLIRMGRKKIVLEKDVVLRDDEPAEPIRIREDVVIDGNGHFIDARNKTNIFHIVEGDIIIKNADLKNGFAENGGAIFYDGNGELTILDCVLSGNVSLSAGAAVYCLNRGLNISNCFISNNLSKDKSNQSTSGGIFAANNVKIFNCEISDNECSNSIISSFRSFQIYGTVFKGNKSKMIIENCTEEKSSLIRGLEGENYYKGVFDIRNCRFVDNDVSGPVIFNDGESCTLVKTVFENSPQGNRNSMYIENFADLNLSGFEMRGPDEKIVNKGIVKIMGEFSSLDKIKGSGKVEFVGREKTFQYLDDMIHGGASEIALDFDIEMQESEKNLYADGIILDVDGLTIDGRGHEINARMFAGIFNVTGRDITLKNIAFKGLKTKGVLIHNAGGLNIVNCSFSNNNYLKLLVENEADLNISDSNFSNNRCEGIYNNGGILSIRNSNFSNNASRFGPPIHNKGRLYIDGSNFEENKSREGGAIFNGTDAVLKINGCCFSSNLATNENSRDCNGGAIFNRGDLTIEKSTFRGNSSDDEGGAIFNKGDLAIEKSVFEENEAVAGGVIAINAADFITIKIDDSKFNNNKSKASAAVISSYTYSEYYDFNINRCSFFNNISKATGIIDISSGSFKIVNCTFSKNRGRENIIRNNDFLQIYESSFEKNKAPQIITNLSKSNSKEILSNFSIFNVSFLNNKVKDAVIYNDSENCLLYGMVSDNNLKRDVGNIINNQCNLTLTNAKINENGQVILNDGHLLIEESQGIEGKIYGTGVIDEKVIDYDYKEFDFAHLDKLIHESDGNAINLEEDIVFQDYEIDFYEGGIDLDIDNLVIDGNGKTIDGAGKSRIFNVTGKNVTLKNIIFKNGLSFKHPHNRFNSHGGALKVNSKAGLKIINCEFIQNRSQDDGGAIYNRGDLTIENSKLSDNSNDGICNRGELNIEGSILSNHSLGIANEGNLFISGSALSQNEDTILNKGKIEMDDCSISDNRSIRNNGDLRIENSTLSRNVRSIYNRGVLSIGNSTFSDNKEGAIVSNGELTVNGSDFKNNSSNKGGAIFNSGDSKIRHCKFYNNDADSGDVAGYGGAISNDGDLVIEESDFCKNNSTKEGSAILNSGDLTIKRSTLSDNYSCQTIYNRGIINIIDSTSSGNASEELYNEGIMNIRDSALLNDNRIAYNRYGFLNISGSSDDLEKYDDGIYDYKGTLIINNKFKKNE